MIALELAMPRSAHLVGSFALLLLPACGADAKQDDKKAEKANPFDPASRLEGNMTKAEAEAVKDAAKQLSE